MNNFDENISNYGYIDFFNYENLDEFKIDKKIEETKKDYKIIELQTH